MKNKRPKMKYNDIEVLDEVDDENEKKTAKEILNKKKVTDFEMDMIFMNEEDEEETQEEE